MAKTASQIAAERAQELAEINAIKASRDAIEAKQRADPSAYKSFSQRRDSFVPSTTPDEETTLWQKILDRLTVKDSNERSWLNKGLLEHGVDEDDIWKTILASLTDAREDAWTGALGIVEGIADAGAMIAPVLLGTDKEKATEFAKKDLINEQSVVREALARVKGAQEVYALVEQKGYVTQEEVERAKKLIEEEFKYMDGRMEDESVLGEKLDSVVQSGGQLLATSALGMAKVPWWLVSGLSAAGGEAESALNEGATYEEALMSGTISGAAEVLTEKLSGAIKFGGKAADDALVTALSRGVSNKLLRNALKFGLDVTGEGAEEVITSLASEFGQWLTYRDDEELGDILFSEQAMDEKIEAFFSGALMGGGSSAANIVSSMAMGVDATSGLTANEEQVVNRVYQDRVAEAEKDGKVTQKRKNQIYDEVVEAMDKGEISVETLEELLGGQTYRDYKMAMDSKEDNDFLSKYDELGSKQGATPRENAQYNEMTEKVKQITENRRNLQSQLRQEVSQMVKGDRLAESYNQKALRGVGFKVDLNKVDEKQRAIYQKAMDSGVINDTRRSHEFVDLVAKIASDKGVDFDFTNNERIKNSGFAVEGTQVNGYVNENGITINMQSAKALNKVVGHEVTHVLEGTGLYDALQQAAFAYAKSKGELTDRWKATKALYKDLNAVEINKEITADLVGDYLFDDKDFVKNLYSCNRNLFEKIYDEVKYLCKVVTAGSKEARQLEKVKKAFADAYRVETKTESGTKYSLAEIVDENQKSYGIGVHLDSTLLDGLSESERVGMVKEYIKELGGESFAAFDPNGKKVSITIAKANEKFKNQRGKVIPINKDLSGKYINNETKQEALVLIDELIVSSKFEKNSPAKYPHGNLDNNGQNSWEYWTTYIQDKNNTIWEATLNVANSADGRKILYDVSPIKKVGRSVKSDSLPTNPIIADDSTNVNTQHSLSSISHTFFGNSDMTSAEFLESDYKQTDGYQNYVDSCLNNMRQTRPNFNEATARKEIEDSVDGIVRVAMAAKAAGYDIYDDNSKRDVKDSKNRLLFSSLEPNSDYFTSSDISTICDKRQNFAEIYDEIVTTEEAMNVPQGKRFFDNVDNYFALHKIMADKGLTQPCRQCYVESMRKNLAPMANAFLRLVNETNPDNLANDQLYHQNGKQKGQQKVNNASTRDAVLAMLDEYGMSASDLNVETLTTAEGLAQLKIQAPMIYEAFNSFYGQSKPKMPKAATPFRFGELTALLTDHNGKVNQKLLDRINSTGGFRLQSYSDFQIQNFTDVLQVIYEAGTLGLNGHAYTKVPAFLDATKGTNLKRNISIFMYKDGDEWKLDRNDSFPYTLDEIYDIVKADRSGNTSIVAVSQNDDMSAWIMANDNVGYGIPFHKSGLKMGTVRDTVVKTEDGRQVKGYTGTKDHTRQQSEVWKNDLKDADGKVIHRKGTKVKDGINIYRFWDFDNPQNLSKSELIEQNLKAYIDACEDAGYLPKFRDYVMNNDKILNNVLEYSKKLGHVGQDATVDDISFEYKGYRIPYGYHKFLVDFGVFTPDGRSAPQRQLSLKNYDFENAENFFADAETVRRNEILQQFANGEERKRYRDSNLTAEQLADIIRQKRGEVAQEIVQRNIGPVKHSLSPENIAPVHRGNYNITSEEVYFDPSAIAPVGENVIPVKRNVQQRRVIAPVPIKNKKQGIISKIVNRTVDKGMVFENLSLKSGNMELQSKWDYALPSKAEARAQWFMRNGRNGSVSLDSVRKKVEAAGKTEAFQDYMRHWRNVDSMTLRERFGVNNKPVFGTSVSADISRKKIAQYEKQNPEFKGYADELYSYFAEERKMMVESGLITEEQAKHMEEMYPHYIPLHREADELLGPVQTNNLGVNTPIKSATGGNRPLQPMFDTIAQHTLQTFKAVARNDFGVELKNTIQTTARADATDADEIFDSIENQNRLLGEGSDGSGYTFSVYENGQKVTFDITEAMYDALKPTDGLLGERIKPLTKLNDIRRNLITSWNPVLALYRNPVKDIQAVMINSQHPLKTYMNVPKAAWELFELRALGKAKGKWANEYLENGGEQNTYYDNRKGAFAREDPVWRKIIGFPARGLESLGEFIERVPRLAEYIASRESGRSVQRSMLDAARVTTNFAAGGDFTKFLNSHGFTFLNAGVQGFSQNVRNFREAKMNGLKGYVQLAAKFTVAGLSAGILNGLFWDEEDDEDYEELSDYVKQNYYVVAKTSDGKFVRIPKGRMAAVIQDGMEQMEHLVTGDDEADFESFFKLVMDNLAPGNPLDNNILAPIAQVLENKTWYGEDLVPSRLADLPAAEQFDESTDSLSKWLGEKMDISPYKINYLIDQYSGGLGDVFLPMMTPEAESGDNSFFGNLKAPWKKEWTTDSVLNNKHPSEFFELSDELEVISNGKNATDEDKVRNLYMSSVGWEMSDLYAEKREIQNSDLPDDQKYEAVREVQKEINALAEKALRNYQTVKVDGLYATAGDKRFDYSEYNGKWYEIEGEYLEKEQNAIKRYGITPSEYWNNTDLFYHADYYFKYAPELENVSKRIFDGKWFAGYAAEVSQIKGDDLNGDGKSDSGTKKKKVFSYIGGLDVDDIEKKILRKMSYPSEDKYNKDILNYLNQRPDLSYSEKKQIVEALGAKVDDRGRVKW